MIETPAPVTLIAGYLGAGKTTWLNARIEAGLPAGALILVNDFGSINVDADLIDYRDDRLIRLTNGCICCSLSDSLAMQLARIARWETPPSALYIETSGVAEPQRLVDLFRVARGFRLAEIICLVDASSVLHSLVDERVGTLVAAQITAADTLSINRRTRLDGPQRAALEATLGRLNAQAGSSLGESANEDKIASGGAVQSGRAAGQDGRIGRPAWARFALTKPEPVSREALEAILNHHADTIVRAKGMLRIDDDRHAVFNWSGRRARWTAAAHHSNAGQLVGIGFAGADFDALKNELEAL